jgi:hypothetical protein
MPGAAALDDSHDFGTLRSVNECSTLQTWDDVSPLGAHRAQAPD